MKLGRYRATTNGRRSGENATVGSLTGSPYFLAIDCIAVTMPTATADDARLYVPNTPLEDPDLIQYLERAERDLQRSYESVGLSYDTEDAAFKTDAEAVQAAIILLSIPGDDRSTESVSLGDWQKSFDKSPLDELKRNRSQLLPDAVVAALDGSRNTNRKVTTTQEPDTVEGVE